MTARARARRSHEASSPTAPDFAGGQTSESVRPSSTPPCCVCVLVAQWCPTLCDPMDYIACQVPLGFPRQEYWSGLPFPSPGDLSDPEIEPGSPALQADS